MSEEEIRKEFEEWYEADAMPAESGWFERSEDYPETYKLQFVDNTWDGYLAAAKLKNVEIERLRKELTDAKVLLDNWQVGSSYLEKENERLRADNEHLREDNAELKRRNVIHETRGKYRDVMPPSDECAE